MRLFYFLLILFVAASFDFKGFSQSNEIKLPAPKKIGEISLEQVLNERRSVREYTAGVLSLEEVSQVLWAAYGKNKWGRLTSPSAGALYPFAIYLVCSNIRGLDKGAYKYDNKNHSLTPISSGDLSQVVSNQSFVKSAPAIIVLCADYKITTDRYGEEGKRWVNIEAGHIGQNIYLQTQSLGLGTVAVGSFNDREIRGILGTNEDPLYILPLGRIK